MGNEELREFSFNVGDATWRTLTSISEETLPEDETDYILEEDKEELNKYIERLISRIRGLNNEIAHLNGAVETWEAMWRIFNNN